MVRHGGRIPRRYSRQYHDLLFDQYDNDVVATVCGSLVAGQGTAAAGFGADRCAHRMCTLPTRDPTSSRLAANGQVHESRAQYVSQSGRPFRCDGAAANVVQGFGQVCAHFAIVGHVEMMRLGDSRKTENPTNCHKFNKQKYNYKIKNYILESVVK